MSVLAVYNIKGGVGKTTLSVNLAYGLAYYKAKRVLLVDMDPQANATHFLLVDQVYRRDYLSDPPNKLTVVDLYNDFLISHRKFGWKEEKVSPKDKDKYLSRIYQGREGYLDLVASKLDLGLVALENSHSHGQVRWLLQHLAGQYDYVFIDCPPTMSKMLWAGLDAAQSVFVPTRPDYLSVAGLPLLDRAIKQIYKVEMPRRPVWLPELQILGLVFTMVDKRTTMAAESISEVTAYAEKEGYRVFKSRVSDSTRFTWGAKLKLPIFRSDPASRYAKEIEAVVEEFYTTTTGREQP